MMRRKLFQIALVSVSMLAFVGTATAERPRRIDRGERRDLLADHRDIRADLRDRHGDVRDLRRDRRDARRD